VRVVEAFVTFASIQLAISRLARAWVVNSTNRRPAMLLTKVGKSDREGTFSGPRLRHSGASYGFHMASIIAGGPAPLIATALLARFSSGYAVALYILFCAVVSIVATSLLPDYTNRDISAEHDEV
jgi:hypothetical protein